MRVSFKSQRFVARLLGITEKEIGAYVASLGRHFSGSVILGPDERLYIDKRGIKLLLKVHMMSIGDGLSLGQIDAILEALSEGRPPRWASGAMGLIHRSIPLFREMVALWGEKMDDPLTESVTRSYCAALYEGLA